MPFTARYSFNGKRSRAFDTPAREIMPANMLDVIRDYAPPSRQLFLCLTSETHESSKVKRVAVDVLFFVVFFLPLYHHHVLAGCT